MKRHVFIALLLLPTLLSCPKLDGVPTPSPPTAIASPVARARSKLLGLKRAGSFTIRATGNREEWRWVEAEPLP